jgi:hypothetical protein
MFRPSSPTMFLIDKVTVAQEIAHHSWIVYYRVHKSSPRVPVPPFMEHLLPCSQELPKRSCPTIHGTFITMFTRPPQGFLSHHSWNVLSPCSQELPKGSCPTIHGTFITVFTITPQRFLSHHSWNFYYRVHKNSPNVPLPPFMERLLPCSQELPKGSCLTIYGTFITVFTRTTQRFLSHPQCPIFI